LQPPDVPAGFLLPERIPRGDEGTVCNAPLPVPYSRGAADVAPQSGPGVDYWKNWAKAGEDSFHLLPCHGLDVAAVLRVLLEDPGWRRAVRVDPAYLCFWAALHDVGKMSRAFQRKVPAVYAELRGLEEVPSPRSSSIWHVPAGRYAWDLAALEFEFVPRRRDATAPLAAAALCHHGRPDDYNSPNPALRWADGREAVFSLIEDVWNHFAPDRPELEAQEAREASWAFAGLMVVADWLASSEAFQPWQKTPVDFDEYWKKRALPQARKVVGSTEIPAPGASGQTQVEELFEFDDPTPLQSAASEVEFNMQPGLAIVEDATGSGKTEAALSLASQLVASERTECQGMYFALPTQATANQMHGRLVDAKSKMFGEPGAVYLAHGNRDLVGGYRAELAQEIPEEQNAWIADHNKLTLLAPIGVGTVDQAVSGILPRDHQSIRLAGLSRSVLVVDEVHAYDAYLNRLLARLLEAQAAAGGAAVLLSATLPNEQRQQFVEAFRKGAGWEEMELDTAEDAGTFPALTVASEGAVEVEPVEAAERSRKRFDVSFVHSREEVDGAALEAASEGCVCVVKNTVGAARATRRRLSEQADGATDVELFHSRFTAADRRAIEEDVVERFGPDGGPEERRGHVLVGTQVLEQSLDLDFDGMFSDLAPVDLLIQRAGRMHRHRRSEQGEPVDGPDERGRATLRVLSPELEDDPEAGWYGEMFPSGQYVYANEAVTWLTARKLDALHTVRIPEDLRDVIAYVYGPDRRERVPEGLVETLEEANRRAREHGALGRVAALEIERGYAVDAGKWSAEASTRIGRDQTTLRLARWRGGEIEPWAAGGRFPWRMSEVDAPAWRTGEVIHGGDADPADVRRLEREQMADRGRYATTAVLEQQDGTWRAEVRNENGASELRYDRSLGLRFVDG